MAYFAAADKFDSKSEMPRGGRKIKKKKKQMLAGEEQPVSAGDLAQMKVPAQLPPPAEFIELRDFKAEADNFVSGPQ